MLAFWLVPVIWGALCLACRITDAGRGVWTWTFTLKAWLLVTVPWALLLGLEALREAI